VGHWAPAGIACAKFPYGGEGAGAPRGHPPFRFPGWSFSDARSRSDYRDVLHNGDRCYFDDYCSSRSNSCQAVSVVAGNRSKDVRRESKGYLKRDVPNNKQRLPQLTREPH